MTTDKRLFFVRRTRDTTEYSVSVFPRRAARTPAANLGTRYYPDGARGIAEFWSIEDMRALGAAKISADAARQILGDAFPEPA